MATIQLQCGMTINDTYTSMFSKNNTLSYTATGSGYADSIRTYTNNTWAALYTGSTVNVAFIRLQNPYTSSV